MGLFKRKKKGTEVLACCNGLLKDLNKVNDEVFAQELAGKGLAITPIEGKFYSPVSGTVITAIDSGHAYGIQVENGLEFLIHIGINTVNLKGKGFNPKVKAGDKVKAGQLICEVDLNYVKEQGKDTDTMLLLCSLESKTKLEYKKKHNDPVKTGDVLFVVSE